MAATKVAWKADLTDRRWAGLKENAKVDCWVEKKVVRKVVNLVGSLDANSAVYWVYRMAASTAVSWVAQKAGTRVALMVAYLDATRAGCLGEPMAVVTADLMAALSAGLKVGR